MAEGTFQPVVLVVDDEPAIRLLCRVNLELDGYAVLEAGTLPEAREQLEGHVDLVLLDLHLGAESGHALVDELEGHDPPIPVAVVTGSAELSSAEQVHADAFLTKPFTIEQLLETVRSLAGPRQRAR